MIGKRYLGDGVYVDVDGRGLVLTTEDGIQATNTIIIEAETLDALLSYLAKTRRKLQVPKGGH